MISTLPTALDLLSIAAAGLFGSALAVQRRLPIVGVMLIGILSALGGGMLRDLLLDTPVVAMHERWYLPVALGSALLGMPLARRIIEHAWVGLVLDGLVLGLFLVGTQKAYFAGLPAVSAVFVGLTTSLGGGTAVELLLGMKPTVLQRGHWFASAALFGAIAVVGLSDWLNDTAVAVIAVLVVAGLRIASVRLDWEAPSVHSLRDKGPPESRLIARSGSTHAPLAHPLGRVRAALHALASGVGVTLPALLAGLRQLRLECRLKRVYGLAVVVLSSHEGY